MRKWLLVTALLAQLASSLAAQEAAPLALSIRLITDHGCVRDWSAQTHRLLMDERDAQGVHQVYTLNPDGSDVRGVTTLPVEGGPAVNRHKGFAHYDPAGRYIVMEVELPEALVGNSARVQKAVSPGSGVWMDLWVVTTDGRRWTNLTNFTTQKLTGALSPYFSADGKKLVYSKLVGAVDRQRSFGTFELHVAEFSDEGRPHLLNDRVLLGGDGVYEAHGFSPDGKRVLFSSDRTLANSMGLDLWEIDLQTSQIRNLTNSPSQYDEHARYSPDGSRIAWGSSMNIAAYRTSLGTLRSDAYVKRTKGQPTPRRLTYFNEPDHAESTDLQSGIWPTAWSPDGRQLVVAQQPLWDLLRGKESPNRSWLVTLNPDKLQ